MQGGLMKREDEMKVYIFKRQTMNGYQYQVAASGGRKVYCAWTNLEKVHEFLQQNKHMAATFVV
jgi:hypothetical protein